MGEVNHQELAAETLRVLAERGWSRKQAEIRTGVGSAIISNMALGFRPRAEALVTWADAIGEDVAHWLRLGGYPQIAEKFEAMRSGAGVGDALERLQTQTAANLRTQREVEAAHKELAEVRRLFHAAMERFEQAAQKLNPEEYNAHC